MSNRESYFSPDFVTAQLRFREAVTARGGRLDSLKLAPRGPAGEELAIDIGWFGASSPRRAMVQSSGLHGVEAFAGSAIQLQWLEKGIPAGPGDSAIVLVHVLNPYGMAWLRRVNENNVDLNRNFRSEETFIGSPEEYRKLNTFLNPPTLPSRDLFYLRAAGLVARTGVPALRQAIAGGQHDYPKGLFFGGERLEQGPAKFQEYIANHFADVKRVVAIDVHTGLGRFGEDRLLVDAAWERTIEPNQTMRKVFGERLGPLRTLGMAYEVRGAQHNMYYRLFPNAQVYFTTQEFGTYNPWRVLEILRSENRWHHYGNGTLDHPTKIGLRNVFNPDDPKWRRLILQRGQEVINQGVSLAIECESE